MEYSRDDDYNFVKWAQSVKKRDFFTCQICGAYGVELNSHHMNGWNWCEDERYDIDNGVTLCVTHHNLFHFVYGKGYNTKDQYKEFEKISKLFIKILENKYLKESAVNKLSVEIKNKIETERVQALLLSESSKKLSND